MQRAVADFNQLLVSVSSCGRGGGGDQDVAPVLLVPFNGKTVREINYQYMVALQRDVGSELERRGLVLKPAAVAAVVRCCHGVG